MGNLKKKDSSFYRYLHTTQPSQQQGGNELLRSAWMVVDRTGTRVQPASPGIMQTSVFGTGGEVAEVTAGFEEAAAASSSTAQVPVPAGLGTVPPPPPDVTAASSCKVL